ncbi:MAG: bifunctional UDP-N-acetylglucosamine diphosphorylase/glucosamine-1-phosphate N-acetyltransferase GlmU [Dokdonella sp.]|jgi:bifunctional UDP-N-acetylglucosamine pyrophosphorylase/glucosamine-1-phosphate N-acetyltransferase|uniref:bifunctional UDP-N-acetylglucosamine diphosphorylase/glucosamine-1-phosphate N-acetyltransferase GlmU n=1 Tax=Dokdonella sp. TaxID=2291710 RepID=UPI001B6388E5|nr:bifunctional UDP-N-acetylglucosamine diphosphorylase/glucosamine-1-phosphate N-acetyltransferase GlmU [Dokdonella sp.]MBK8124151.1 bifunctional UDP-N-acetylglucosamine diphosphorylase/glucosamine-1-phosphate N-acetyltransferase GlmU [Dokdonella sp.]MBP6326406.1 bifunctional UDP-N-acetylglucosamine diphosphorylase/glucosamine-1-phosphate N-acetyltransferase GlmU [Dokdonella sp.]MBP6329200.1 bifunctional UDP-N-acetylglucosamine diphosphorylase/glucosamine-1-phosphate N-acetyltransferase GlmU [D
MSPAALHVVILAAGEGKRMKSARPKVLMPLAGRPMLGHVLDTARALNPSAIHIVYGHGGDQVRAAFADPDLSWILQSEQRGTGHAVKLAMAAIPDGARVIVLYGDVPLISRRTLDNLLGSSSGLTALVTQLEVPYGYGRIVRDGIGRVRAIVEEKDCTIEQRAITWVNSGILVADARRLRVWLNNLSDDNAQHEYYLTDIYAQADEEGDPADACECNNSQEVFGANDPWQLAALERLYQRMQATALASQGVRFADPIRFDVRGKVSVGRDVEIDVDVILEGEVHIGDEVTIGPFTRISNSRLAAGTVIHAHCDIEGVTTHGPCVIGPFARLRPGTELGAGSRIGNFVETKKLKLGAGSKINHLSYIGDAEVGQHANIGAGTITCNYDGVNKHQTQIGDGAFIGSNSALVAPVAIGRNATIGAGSVITRNAPDDELTVGRSRQATIPGWRRPKKS